MKESSRQIVIEAKTPADVIDKLLAFARKFFLHCGAGLARAPIAPCSEWCWNLPSWLASFAALPGYFNAFCIAVQLYLQGVAIDMSIQLACFESRERLTCWLLCTQCC